MTFVVLVIWCAIWGFVRGRRKSRPVIGMLTGAGLALVMVGMIQLVVPLAPQ